VADVIVTGRREFTVKTRWRNFIIYVREVKGEGKERSYTPWRPADIGDLPELMKRLSVTEKE
jgi:hypothetical protein